MLGKRRIGLPGGKYSRVSSVRKAPSRSRRRRGRRLSDRLCASSFDPFSNSLGGKAHSAAVPEDERPRIQVGFAGKVQRTSCPGKLSCTDIDGRIIGDDAKNAGRYRGHCGLSNFEEDCVAGISHPMVLDSEDRSSELMASLRL